jgi:hypothetical protein
VFVQVANDLKKERIPSLIGNLLRLGVKNAIVTCRDGREVRVFGGDGCVCTRAPLPHPPPHLPSSRGDSSHGYKPFTVCHCVSLCVTVCHCVSLCVTVCHCVSPVRG